MEQTVANLMQDVMEVCRNGHVVTCRAGSCPEESRYHCECCGANTLRACPTCGQELPGAIVVPGLQPIGLSKAPAYCSTCGAALPWTRRKRSADSLPVAQTLETFFRRLPLVIRQFRQRFRTRPPLAIEDAHDLDDIVRSLLPLYFDHVHLRSRTPAYAAANRTDLLIEPQGIVCTLKHTSSDLREPELAHEMEMDAAFYRTMPECRSLWIYVYDPQAFLHEAQNFETCWSRPDDGPALRCVISG